jgi:hypothetical protein
MTKETSYRLGRYEIIEKGNGDLWWKSHGGFANVNVGKCFGEGDILFIGASKGEESGLLKNEFILHLNRLPKWEKTKYYCSSYTIYSCNTGRRSFLEEMGKGLDQGGGGSVTNSVPKKVMTSKAVMTRESEAVENIIKIKGMVTGTWELFRNWLSKVLH